MKRTKYLQPLSHDHHHGLQAAAYLRRELARGTSHDILASFVADLWTRQLAGHFDAEERLLLPLMKTTAARESARRMVDDHKLIRRIIDRIAAEEDSRVDNLSRLSEVLAAHIRFEERELFPALEATTPEAVLQEIADRLHGG